MTNTIDNFWIARGVDAQELTNLKGRSAIYAGFFSMMVTATVLVGGIFSNLTAPVA